MLLIGVHLEFRYCNIIVSPTASNTAVVAPPHDAFVTVTVQAPVACVITITLICPLTTPVAVSVAVATPVAASVVVSVVMFIAPSVVPFNA